MVLNFKSYKMSMSWKQWAIFVCVMPIMQILAMQANILIAKHMLKRALNKRKETVLQEYEDDMLAGPASAWGPLN